jgi:hypothetical protein
MNKTTIYNINLNSRNSNVVYASTDLTQVTFYVNWVSCIPLHKYRKYNCSFTFRSEVYAGLISSIGYVNFNAGKSEIYDGLTQSFKLGTIYPVALTSTNSYYNCTTNDNTSFILYPNENMITLKLNNYSGSPLSNMQHFNLQLSLIPIDE